MELIEFYRARTALFWHVGILALVVLAVMSLGHQAEVNVVGPDGTHHISPHTIIPFAALAPIAMFYAAIFGSTLGTSLNRENSTREISWTKPMSRTNVAVRFIAIDLVTVALVYALTFGAVIAVLAWLNVPTLMDDSFPSLVILGLGGSLMWYGLVQALTFWLPSGGRAIGGIIWPVMLALAGLAHIDGPVGKLATILDVINPLAYMSGVNHTTSTTTDTSVFQAPAEMRSLAVWFFAAVFCAIAIAFWPKKEA